MSVFILARAVDGLNLDDPMSYKKGYMIHARNSNQMIGRQIPPNFIQVEITDADDASEIEDQYCRTWRRDIDYEFVAHDSVLDGHRIKVFMKAEVLSVSGLNSLTREQIESFLDEWNAEIYSVLSNEVVFDVLVFDAIKSEGFLGGPLPLLGWSEISYDQETGTHRVEVNFSNYPNLTNEKVEKFIIRRGGIVAESIPNKVTFDIQRLTVLNIFKEDVKRKVDGHFSRRIYQIPVNYVNAALGNGGTISVTKQQFLQYVHNRLDD